LNNIFIISYDCSRLGNYFLCCNKDIQSFLSTYFAKTTIRCTHNNCDRNILHSELSSCEDNYVVTIYAHGKDDKIIDNSENDLINIDDARSSYNNAIVYSTSCYSANQLGIEMHKYGCKFFFGYSEKSYVCMSSKDIFIELDNFALKKIFLNNTIDGQTIYEETNTFFENKLEEMRDINPLVAPLIMHNKESFKIYHNQMIYPS
jgi:hypothetical protein